MYELSLEVFLRFVKREIVDRKEKLPIEIESEGGQVRFLKALSKRMSAGGINFGSWASDQRMQFG